MGCIQSKPRERQGLHSQQEDLIINNNQEKSKPEETQPGINSPKRDPIPSRYSPPTSQKTHSTPSPLDGLGSLEEVWSSPKEWSRFKAYLAKISEGQSSEGQELSLDRYSKFLECFANLDMGEIEERRKLVIYMKTFFDREQCLRCVDGGMRKEVLERIKSVDSGQQEPGRWVFNVVYPRVVDMLTQQLGNYQNFHTEMFRKP